MHVTCAGAQEAAAQDFLRLSLNCKKKYCCSDRAIVMARTDQLSGNLAICSYLPSRVKIRPAPSRTHSFPERSRPANSNNYYRTRAQRGLVGTWVKIWSIRTPARPNGKNLPAQYACQSQATFPSLATNLLPDERIVPSLHDHPSVPCRFYSFPALCPCPANVLHLPRRVQAYRRQSMLRLCAK